MTVTKKMFVKSILVLSWIGPHLLRRKYYAAFNSDENNLNRTI